MNDDQLKAFLQKHQPRAPELNNEEILGRSLGRLGLDSRRRRWAWMTFSGLAAAGIVAAVFVAKPIVQDSTLSTPAAIEALFEGDFLYEDEELPTFDAGEDYEALAQNLSLESEGR